MPSTATDLAAVNHGAGQVNAEKLRILEISIGDDGASIDPRDALGVRPVSMLFASPNCVHFTKPAIRAGKLPLDTVIIYADATQSAYSLQQRDGFVPVAHAEIAGWATLHAFDTKREVEAFLLGLDVFGDENHTSWTFCRLEDSSWVVLAVKFSGEGGLESYADHRTVAVPSTRVELNVLNGDGEIASTETLTIGEAADQAANILLSSVGDLHAPKGAVQGSIHFKTVPGDVL